MNETTNGFGQTLAMQTATSSRPRLRLVAIWLLIVLASVLAFGTAANVWVKRQILSTPAWVDASTKILEDPAVQSALATYVVDQIYENVDVQEEVAAQLPDNWEGLAGPIASGIRQPATTLVERLLGTSQVQSVWREVNEQAHRTLVAILEDRTPILSTSNGQVSLDLGDFIRTLAADVGLPSSAVNLIPDDAGRIQLFESSELRAMQRAVSVINWMSTILLVVILGMYALAIYLARGARRRTVRNIGWSLAVVGVVILILRRVTGNVVTSIVSDPDYSPAAKAVYAVASQLLGEIAWGVTFYGIAVVLGMTLLGPTTAAVAIRRFVAPVTNLPAKVFWTGAAVLFLLALWWNPTPTLGSWIAVLISLVLYVVGLELLRRRNRRDFPDAQLQIDTEAAQQRAVAIATSVRDRVRTMAESRRSRRGGEDPVERLQRLQDLHERGVLDDEEFKAAKAKFLA